MAAMGVSGSISVVTSLAVSGMYQFTCFTIADI